MWETCCLYNFNYLQKWYNNAFYFIINKKQMSKTPKSFEDAIARLEELTQQIQSNETPLEDALKNYEEGRKLVQFCRQKLAEVEQKLHILDNEELVPVDLDNPPQAATVKTKAARKADKPAPASDELWGNVNHDNHEIPF